MLLSYGDKTLKGVTLMKEAIHPQYEKVTIKCEMGITVVTITHYMNEAVEADRIVVMNQGEIIADGAPKEIFSQVEKLQSVSLDVPQVAELMYLLEQDGIDAPRGVLHAMDAAEVITKLYENR